MRGIAALLLSALLSPALPAAAEPPAADPRDVEQVLDAFHQAASRADEEAYFALLAPQGVFLGTDATERWEKEAFRAFAHPYFAQGKGWTFVPRNRHVARSADGRVAWFDELLDSATYGECRGSGVLEHGPEGWKIQQYHLTIPIPNDLAKNFVARIRDAAAAKKGAP
ncbi:MAG TPA: nuclear transport factor 2 family protein [Thermoanaerobaculia bacterium]|nr:nuclear transport factor 2 family protein [Thermoanaerobaculia bacterium]